MDVSAFSHVGHFTTRGRASIKKAQTMANDLAVNLVPSSEPPSINKTETEANVAYVFVKKKRLFPDGQTTELVCGFWA